MVRSRFAILRAEKAVNEGRKGTEPLREIERDTGLALRSLHNIDAGKSEMVRYDTIGKLCKYFGGGVGELLEYVPDAGTEEAK